MKLRQFVCSGICAFASACFMNLNAGPRTFDGYQITNRTIIVRSVGLCAFQQDLEYPLNRYACFPDKAEGCCEKAFVFTAQNPNDGKFDVHFKYMEEDFKARPRNMDDYVGDVVATGCVRAVIFENTCYQDGFILNTAREITEDGRYCHCSMYLLKREGKSIKSLPFAELANIAGIFPFAVEESLFRARAFNSHNLANVWMYVEDRQGKDGTRLWQTVVTKIDLASLTNHVERIVRTSESKEPQGLSLREQKAMPECR